MIGAEIGRMNLGFSYNMGLGDMNKEGNNGFTAVLGFDIENFIKPAFNQ